MTEVGRGQGAVRRTGQVVVGSLVALMVFGSASAFAQERLPPIPADKLTEAQKKAAAEFLVERKQAVFGPFVPLSRSPQLMINAARMGTYLRFGNSLPRDVSEFAILLVSRRWTQQYEWYVHAADGKTAGLSDAIIQAVADGRRPEGMSEGMEIVYDFSNELNDFHSVTDRTYARMVAKYGEQGMMDLVGLNGYYSMISMVLNVGRTALPPGNTPALKPFPK
jgi:4-carboxymuconolactone decarboxylase